MKIEVRKINAREWGVHGPAAHMAVFSEVLPPEYDRIDFALLAVDADEQRAIGYLTARELDADTVYLKHGGSFPPIKGGHYSLPCYQALVGELLTRYKQLTTLVENKNVTYLKFAMHVGFRIIGLRNFKNQILVELFLERES